MRDWFIGWKMISNDAWYHQWMSFSFICAFTTAFLWLDFIKFTICLKKSRKRRREMRRIYWAKRNGISDFRLINNTTSRLRAINCADLSVIETAYSGEFPERNRRCSALFTHENDNILIQQKFNVSNVYGLRKSRCRCQLCWSSASVVDNLCEFQIRKKVSE